MSYSEPSSNHEGETVTGVPALADPCRICQGAPVQYAEVYPRAGNGKAPHNPTTATAKEAAQILTGRRGNLVKILTHHVMLPYHPPPPLLPLIQVLGAPKWRDSTPLPVEVIESDGSNFSSREQCQGTTQLIINDDAVNGGVWHHINANRYKNYMFGVK